MINAIRVHRTGGPDVLHYEQVEIGEPGPGEARVRHEAVGLNFIDVYFRTGLYKAAKMPFTPGNEGAGIVVAVGAGVENVRVGERVAYAATPGSYADERILPADRLVKVPDTIDLKTAASMMLKGMTAQYLLRRTFRVEPGQTILFHAAAGGVGLIAGQWAKHLGATVIGTAGSEENRACQKAWLRSCHQLSQRKLRRTGARTHKWRGRGRCLRLGWPRYLYGLARRTETAWHVCLFRLVFRCHSAFRSGYSGAEGLSLSSRRARHCSIILPGGPIWKRRLLSFSMSWKAGRSRSRSTRPTLSRTPARPMKHWRHARRQARASCCHRWGR